MYNPGFILQTKKSYLHCEHEAITGFQVFVSPVQFES